MQHTNNNDNRLTQAVTRAQASDYSRKQLAYKAPRNCPKLGILDVMIMLFLGMLTTFVFAFLFVGE